MHRRDSGSTRKTHFFVPFFSWRCDALKAFFFAHVNQKIRSGGDWQIEQGLSLSCGFIHYLMLLYPLWPRCSALVTPRLSCSSLYLFRSPSTGKSQEQSKETVDFAVSAIFAHTLALTPPCMLEISYSLDWQTLASRVYIYVYKQHTLPLYFTLTSLL